MELIANAKKYNDRIDKQYIYFVVMSFPPQTFLFLFKLPDVASQSLILTHNFHNIFSQKYSTFERGNVRK